MKENVKKKTQGDRDDFERKEIWLKPDIAKNIKMLAVKNDMSYKEYCEYILTKHSERNNIFQATGQE